MRVARCTVVQNAAVCRPCPRPVQRIADAGWVAVVAASHLVARRRPAARPDPASTHGGAVCTHFTKASQLFTRLADDLAVSIGQVNQCLAVVFLGNFLGSGVCSLGVRPPQVDDGVGELAAVRFVQLFHAQVQPGHDGDVSLGFTWGISRFPVPLQHPRRAHYCAIFFGKAGGGQAEYFSLDRRSVYIIELAVVLPELGGFSDQRVHDHQELQLLQAFTHVVRVRQRSQWVKALGNVTIDLALHHHVGDLQHVVLLVQLGQVIERPVVFSSCSRAEPCLHQVDVELGRVLPEVHLTRTQCLGRASTDVLLVLLFAFVG